MFMQLSEPDFVKANRRLIEYLESDDDKFDAQCKAENERRDALFLEARQIARENIQWLSDLRDAGQQFEYQQFKFIIDKDTYPAVYRGKVIRIDPVPQLDDEFVAWVVQCINGDREMDQLQVDSKLSAESLRAAVSVKLFPFSDFTRNLKTGQPDPTNPDNVRVFLKMQQVELRWNDWHRRIEIQEREPWGTKRRALTWAPLSDTIIGRLMTHAGDSQYQFRPAEQLFRRALETIARETLFNPVVDYLTAAEAKWDGVHRLATWLSRACGVPCDPYHMAVGKNVLGGMVKRAREPGAKHDEVMILIGAQGTFKSSLCRTLAGQPEYFTDSVAFDGSPQNVIPQLFGKWVVELSEMDGMATREVSFLKAFISRQSDNVTLKYRAIAEDHARRCIFIGTSNDDRILRDATGNRRFLPVRINQAIDVGWVREKLDLLLGEAAALHSAGANFTIPTEVVPAAQAHQEAARVEADFEVFLDEWFGGNQPCLVKATDVSTALRETCGRSVPANKYGPAMKRLGFLDGTVRLNGKPTWCWKRGQADQRNVVTIHRDTNGRLLPVQRPGFTPVVVPLVPSPGQATAS